MRILFPDTSHHSGGCITISAKELTINDDIRATEVRMLDENNSQLGIMSLADAKTYAYDKGLDLVLIAPTAEPPVCRAMDYGKYRYEADKREKEELEKSIKSKYESFKAMKKKKDIEVDGKIEAAQKTTGIKLSDLKFATEKKSEPPTVDADQVLGYFENKEESQATKDAIENARDRSSGTESDPVNPVKYEFDPNAPQEYSQDSNYPTTY